MILEKKNYKKIEHYLYSQFEANQQLEIVTDDIIYGCKSNHLGEEIGASISTSNESKVERAALQLAELYDDENTKWIEVINDTLKQFEGTEYKTLIELTYNKQYRVTKIMRMMNLERTGYYDRKNDVIIQVALNAASKGLIENKVEKSVGENK